MGKRSRSKRQRRQQSRTYQSQDSQVRGRRGSIALSVLSFLLPLLATYFINITTTEDHLPSWSTNGWIVFPALVLILVAIGAVAASQSEPWSSRYSTDKYPGASAPQIIAVLVLGMAVVIVAISVAVVALGFAAAVIILAIAAALAIAGGRLDLVMIREGRGSAWLRVTTDLLRFSAIGATLIVTSYTFVHYSMEERARDSVPPSSTVISTRD